MRREQAGLRRPIDEQVEVGFLAVVAARGRTEHAHVRRTGLGGQGENFAALDFQEFGGAHYNLVREIPVSVNFRHVASTAHIAAERNKPANESR